MKNSNNSLALKYLFVISVILLISCEKQGSVYIPLHTNSFSWAMNALPYTYINKSGDTLMAEEKTINSSYTNQSGDLMSTEDHAIYYEVYEHTLKIDTFLTYNTTLIAELLDGQRQDYLDISLKKTGSEVALLIGTAESMNSFPASNSVYYDSLSINNVLFREIYTTSNTDQSLSMFINQSSGLAGFALNKDTFNIVN